MLLMYFFSHAAPFYLAHRGGCLCYSGDFICAKEDFTKAFKRDQVPVGESFLFGGDDARGNGRVRPKRRAPYFFSTVSDLGFEVLPLSNDKSCSDIFKYTMDLYSSRKLET